MEISASAEQELLLGLLASKDSHKSQELINLTISCGISLAAGAIVISDKLHDLELAHQSPEETDKRRATLVHDLQKVVLSMMVLPIKPDSELPFEAAKAFAAANVERFLRNPGENGDDAEKLCGMFTKGMISGLAMAILGPQAGLAEKAGCKFDDSEELVDSCTDDALETLTQAAQQVTDKWGSYFLAMAEAAVAARPKKDSRGVE